MRFSQPSPCVPERCAACGLIDPRREFLRETSRFLLSGVVALGVGRACGAVLLIRFDSALRVRARQAVYPVPQEDGAIIDREHEVILMRYQGRIYAFAIWCPHQRAALRWQEGERRFQCPKHKSTFQPDGIFLAGRATRAMDRYALHREGDTIIVHLAQVYRQDADPAGWDAAAVVL